MRRHKRLFDRIIAPEHLERSCDRAARGKRCRADVARFLFQKERRLLELQEALAAGSWRPLASGLHLIYEPKPRVISVAPFENSVVHHALVDVLEPRLGRSYLPDTYACLAGRGAHRAILRHQACMRRHRFLLQLDVRKYFPSVVHARLLEVLERHVADARVLELCRVILSADQDLYLRPEVLEHLGDPAYCGRSGRGLPIGTLTSQFFGNFFLNDLDHFIKRTLKIPDYLRYMDNLTCFGDSRSHLLRHGREIARWLREERGLELKPRRDPLRPCHARILYLGYELTRETRRPGPLAFHRLERTLRRFVEAGRPERGLVRLERSLESYRALIDF